MEQLSVRRSTRRTLALAAVVAAALSFGYGWGWPDVSRLGLTEAIALDGSLRIDRYAPQTQDRADYQGHFYSDKAPGNSFLALPSFELIRMLGAIGPRERAEGVWHERGLLWLLRALTGGLAFVATLVLVNVAAERVAGGTGTLTAVTVGLATMAMPLAATTFSHLGAGALAFAGLLLLWRRGTRHAPALAGACSGAAVLFEYTIALAALVLLLYVIVRRGLRASLFFLAGATPFTVALAAYNAAAFGSPFHFSYRYEARRNFPAEQQQGFFGIHVPTLDSVLQTLVGHRGLFLVSPVLLLAVVALGFLWRRGHGAEAAVAAAVAAALTFVAAGYFEPYGGLSPGPRYMASALPFLALGLPYAYLRWPRTTAILTLLSTAATLYVSGIWGPNFDWATVWWWLGLPRALGMGVVVALIACGLALAAPELSPLLERSPRRRPRDALAGDRQA